MSDETQTPDPPSAVASPYMTVDEAAAYCRCKVSTIRNSRVKTGHPVSMAGSGRLLFTREALDRWLGGAGKPKRGRPRKGVQQ
jgi:excisionase family DNA binding protein